MSIRIRIEHGQDAGKTWRLGQPGVYVVGRHTASSLRVLDMKVSKAHAEVHVVEKNGASNAVFRDLGSTHGSMLNGQPVNDDKPLRPGDELRLGLTILRVLSDGAGDDVAPATDRNIDESSVSTATSSSGMIDTSSARKLPPDELVGKTLGGYKVQQKIGKGGMGAVYLAEQVSLHRQVALKVLSDKFVKDEAFVDQFLNEARAAGQLNHPNVVQVYDVGEAQDHYYFSMEFVAGGSIEERLRGDEGYSWQEALNWFLDATNALVFAKKRDILHRDVKPDNLMISEDGSAKLCDLGLAKRSENKDLMDQGIIGTPHFISPEAIRRKTAVDHRTDLYSLGCTFFRILAGENPYPGATVKEILLGHLNKPVPHLTDHNKAIPKELDEIVFKLMQKDPDERFQTPDELLVSLDKVRVRHGLEAHGIAPKGGKRWIVLAAIAVLVAAGAAIFALNQEEKTITREDPEAVRLREEAARQEIVNRYPPFASEAQGELLEIKNAVINLKAGDPINYWSNPDYKKQATNFDDFVDKWEKRIGEWKEERAKYKHEEILSTIDGVVSKVESEVGSARGDAKIIRGTIEKREATKAEVAETRANAIGDITKALDSKKTELQALMDAGPTDFTKWVDLAIALGADVEKAKTMITELVQPTVDAAVVQGEPVLDFEKDVQPLIDKRFPEAQLKRWIDNPRTQILSKNAQAIGKAGELAAGGGTRTVESLQAGIDFLNKWIEQLPETVDAASGKIAKDIGDSRKLAVERRDKIVEQREEKVFLGLLTDRLIYQAMIREIRAPATYGGGLWSRFKHAQARLTIQEWNKRLETDEYKALGAIWLRDTTAFTALFERLKASWDADKWGGERNVVYIDDEGAEHKCRCQAVELDRMEDKKDVILFEQLGPARLLDSIFFGKKRDEVKPRFDFQGADFRGLALLAEMAGDFKRAGEWWKKYESSVEAGSDEANDARHHLALLPKEEEAGGIWLHLQKQKAALLGVIDRFNPTKRQLDPEDWGKFLDEVPDLNRKLGEIQDGLDTLWMKPELAASVWSSSLRGEPHHGAAYAGDDMPKAVYDKLIKRAKVRAFGP